LTIAKLRHPRECEDPEEIKRSLPLGNNDDKDDLSPEERELFKDSMRHVKPLEEGKDHSEPIGERHDDIDELPEGDYTLSEFESEAPVTSTTVLTYKDPSISDKIFKSLKAGKIPIDEALDLHGMIVDEAHEAMQIFLREAQQNGWRCVRIVHGKGHKAGDRPILKNKVNNWLRQLRCVLAFCSATRQDGGTGAVYVLLRR